jgi:hypothetical protein
MAWIPLARKKKVVTLLVLYMDLLNQLFFMTYLTTIIILRYRSIRKKSGGNSYHRHLVHVWYTGFKSGFCDSNTKSPGPTKKKMMFGTRDLSED